MRVLMLAHQFNLPSDVGGVRTWQIGRYLVRRGHDVSVVVPGVHPVTGQVHPEMRGKLVSRSQVEGINIFRTATFKNNRRSLVSRILYMLSQSLGAFVVGLMMRRSDVLLTTAAPPSTLFLGWVLARLRGARLAIDVRDLNVDAAIELGYIRRSPFVELVLKMERFVLRRAECVISVSEALGQIAVDKGAVAARITIVPIGFEPAVFESADWGHDVREEYGLQGKFVVVYAGALGFIPDIPTLLGAAEQLKEFDDICFLIIGDGQKRFEYEHFCRDRGLDNCRFLGFQPRKTIPVFCVAGDICVNLLPSGKYWPGIIGSKDFDYMASGRPLVFVGDDGGTADLLKASGGGVVVGAGDVSGLVTAILRLRADADLRKVMGEKGRQFVLDNFSADSLMPTIEIALQAALA